MTDVRGLFFAAIVAFSSPSSALVAEAVSGDLAVATASPVVGEPASFLEAAAIPPGVVITPVPMPASVAEALKPIGKAPKLRAVKKSNLAKQKTFPPILLSRTERHQLALLVASTETGNAALRRFLLHDENNESGYDELVLQRFYSRPRLASEPEDDEDETGIDDLSETVKLRLLFARLKAVEAHALAQVADPGDDLPESVRQRLAAARQLAVAAHSRKFS
jgi:hypothetical protein